MSCLPELSAWKGYFDFVSVGTVAEAIVHSIAETDQDKSVYCGTWWRRHLVRGESLSHGFEQEACRYSPRPVVWISIVRMINYFRFYYIIPHSVNVNYTYAERGVSCHVAVGFVIFDRNGKL